MYMYIVMYMSTCFYVYMCIDIFKLLFVCLQAIGPAGRARFIYTRSPLEDSRLFGPSPWKILSHYL